MMNGKQGVVEFRNPFDKPTDFSLQAGIFGKMFFGSCFAMLCKDLPWASSVLC